MIKRENNRVFGAPVRLEGRLWKFRKPQAVAVALFIKDKNMPLAIRDHNERDFSFMKRVGFFPSHMKRPLMLDKDILHFHLKKVQCLPLQPHTTLPSPKQAALTCSSQIGSGRPGPCAPAHAYVPPGGQCRSSQERTSAAANTKRG